MVENKYPHKYPVLFGYLCEKLMSRAVKPLLASQIEAVKPKEKDFVLEQAELLADELANQP